ncbi:DUF2147 domain-containing protein [uncultured Helicobacter sp.]|uniref:DUF2147 domain-containing protein n=1 Tax=uncultured Helicobacter sp. TaxID=175537 RepID=UPI0037501AFC
MFLKMLMAGCLGMVSLNAAVSGIYLLPKDDKGKGSVAEIFEKNGRFYGVGFAASDGSVNTDVDSKNPNKALQSRPVRGSVFLEMSCKSDDTCVGRMYSFDKGKIYPIKSSLKNDNLSIKIDVLFGPTLEWQKLSEEQAKPFADKRLDVQSLDTKME